MTADIWLTLAIIFLIIGALCTTKIAPHAVLMGGLTLFSVAGVLTPEEALAGFSTPGVITIAAMFIISSGIKSTGGINLICEKILGSPKSTRAAIARILAVSAPLSAILNNTPVVAAFIPAIHSWSKKIDIAESKLMIPLSYGAILGGSLTLIGTSTNLAVNSQYQLLTGQESLDIFFLSGVSLPVVICASSFIIIFFARWLPNRSSQTDIEHIREFTCEVQIDPAGPLIGKDIAGAGLRQLRRLYLVEIERNGQIITPVSPKVVLQANDRLVFAGDTQAISELLKINGTKPSTYYSNEKSHQVHTNRTYVHAVVSTHCGALGYALRDSNFRERYGAAVLAVTRDGNRVKGNLGNIILQAGDTLLLEAPHAFFEQQKHSKDFLLVSNIEDAPRHEKAYLAWAILLLVVVCASTSMLSIMNSALIGAAAMLLTKCCNLKQAEQSIDLRVLICLGASISLGTALHKVGISSYLANFIIEASQGRLLISLILIYFSVALLTELMTNNTSALLLLPTALAIADEMHISHIPFLIAVMMAASSSFATPFGYHTNLMVYGPGKYQFNDFLKVGVPLNLLVGLLTVALLYLVWGN